MTQWVLMTKVLMAGIAVVVPTGHLKVSDVYEWHRWLFCLLYFVLSRFFWPSGGLETFGQAAAVDDMKD